MIRVLRTLTYLEQHALDETIEGIAPGAVIRRDRRATVFADVAAIVDELNEELGPDGPLAPVRTVSEAPSAEPLSTRSATASLHAHIDHIEERIERLEKTVGAAVDLLHRLLHPDKVTKPATPGSQR